MKPFRFGIIGEYQSGKSLLINCLLHRSIATVGVGNATTHTIVNYLYAIKEHVVYQTEKGELKTLPIEELHELDTETGISVIDVYLSNDLLKNFILTDMPGFGANDKDNVIARKTLHDIDFAILIAWSEKDLGADSDSYSEINALQTYNIPYFFILNCTNTDRWRCDDIENINIAKKDLLLLDFYKPSCYPLERNGVNIVNLMWYWYSICTDNDELIGRKKYQSPFKEYGICPQEKVAVGEASNFELIKRIFDMDNIAFLELKRDIKEEIQRLKNEVCPIGTIMAFACNAVPGGWALCDGHEVNIEEFPALYRVIGTIYGGDGINTFRVPDLRGRFIRGYDASGMIDKKRVFGSPQDDAIQQHGHDVNVSKADISFDGNHAHRTSYVTYKGAGSWGPSYSTYEVRPTGSTASFTDGKGTSSDGRHSHNITFVKGFISDAIPSDNNVSRVDDETRPKNIALTYCIKTR